MKLEASAAHVRAALVNTRSRVFYRLLVTALLLGATTTVSPRVSAQGGGTAPGAPEVTDVAALLLEVARKERAMLERRLEYTWTTKITDRELNKRGEVSKQSVSVYEVYPVRGEFARKLVARDGVPISRDEAEKELKRTAERLEQAAREQQKRAEGKAPAPRPPTPAEAQNPAGFPSFGFSTGQRRGNAFGSDEISMAVWRFFRYAEFTSPRRERLRGRDAIVLDFRPRTDFRPANDLQKPYARLAGRLWIDEADRAVIRLEAWPDEARPAAANPNASREPSVVFEHERQADGVWLESLVRIKTHGHKEVFNGIELDLTKEAGDFRRFEAGAGDDRLDTPQKQEEPPRP